MPLSHEQRVKIAQQNADAVTQEEKDLALSVRQDSWLIQSNSFAMTIREQRLLLYCISRIKPTDTGTEKYQIKIRDVCRACGITSNITGEAYNAVKDALKTLDSFNFILTDKNRKNHIVHWIRSVEIDPADSKRASVEFEFDPKVAPYLFNVRKFFTQYELGCVIRMKSIYGVRLYQLLKSYSYLSSHKKRFELAELRKLLSAEEASYKKYGLFRSRVIEPALRDISTYSDLKVDYVEIKEKYKVVAVEFIITDIGGTAEYYERQSTLDEKGESNEE